jgi:UDP-glucose 4-epimerase
MSKKRILICGANGYIGKQFIRSINEHQIDFDINLLDIEFGNQLENLQFTYFEGSMLNKNLLNAAMKNVDLVFHFSGKAIVRKGIELLADDFDNDVSGTIHLLNTMVKNGVNRVVFLSSGGAVYGVKNNLPIKEDSSLNPISTYGLVKKTCEELLKFYFDNHGIKSVVFRVASIYGPNYNKIGKQGVIPTFIDCYKKKSEINVYGTGDEIRDFLFIEDLTALLIETLHNFKEGTFNIGTGYPASVNHIIGYLNEITNYQPAISFHSRNNQDILSNVLDISKVKKYYAWRPNIGLKDGISICWAEANKKNF